MKGERGGTLKIHRERRLTPRGDSYLRDVKFLFAIASIALAAVLASQTDMVREMMGPGPQVEQPIEGPPVSPPVEPEPPAPTDLATDTDQDTIPDSWERLWTDLDSTAQRPLVDALDPTDIFEDPDDDGYDYDRDGQVEGCDDMIAPSRLGIALASDYTPVELGELLGRRQALVGARIVAEGAYLVDDGPYGMGRTPAMHDAVEVHIAGSCDALRKDWVRVDLEAHCNRPVLLEQYSPSAFGDAKERCMVDVQGVVEVENGVRYIRVRGHERFTNTMEYLAGYYTGDPSVAEVDRSILDYTRADPTDPDTDDDGMRDGWEARYGRRHCDGSGGPWVWDVQLDPTRDGDAYLDPDGDAIETRWSFAGWLWVDPDGDGEFEPPSDNNVNDPVKVGVNVHEYLSHTNPLLVDTDGDSYPAGSGNMNDFDEMVFHATDPVRNDTDVDGMLDGWEVFYNLMPWDAWDGIKDEDRDGLLNQLEFLDGCHPRDNDTDDDLMWDGWEVEFGLDPLDPVDANADVDVVGSEPPRSAPDGLTNLQEFLNGSDPWNPDTDDDHLTDYEEVVVGWSVTVDGIAQHYHTDPASADTDRDEWSTFDGGMHSDDDEDGDGNKLPSEELLDGIDNDGDSVRMQDNGWDDDRDGVVDDGRAGIPAVGLPEGVDEEVDLNDWNEIFVFLTSASLADSDLDGLPDGVEWYTDLDHESQGVQRTSPVLSDTDGDGLTDRQEIMYIDGGQTPPPPRPTDPLDPDSDDDGLSDGLELLFDHDPDTPDVVDPTDPWDPDTDGDGMSDGDEFNCSDYDRDGLPTWWERAYLWPMMRFELSRDADGSGRADILEDLDGDGLACLEEYIRRWDPLDADTDGDGVLDDEDARSVPQHLRAVRRIPICSDSDGDLMPDWWEIRQGLDPDVPDDKWVDPDRDELLNIDEYIYDLDPSNPDTDGDGATDLFDHELMCNPDAFDADADGMAGWWEKLYPGILDPGNPEDGGEDPDGDGLTNRAEWSYGDMFGRAPTDPTNADTDGDGLIDSEDAHPVNLPLAKRPLNPTRGHEPLHPLFNMTDWKRPQAALDMDDDGLTNLVEVTVWRTDPADPDVDEDGMPDGWEVEMAAWDPATARRNLDPTDPSDAPNDPDWDGLSYTLERDAEGNYIITIRDINLDGWEDWTLESETLCNLEEYLFGEDPDRDGLNEVTYDPNAWDTDGDRMEDGWEVLFGDLDGDGIVDFFELMYGLSPFDGSGVNGAEGDPDGDGRTNLDEFKQNTNPVSPD